MTRFDLPIGYLGLFSAFTSQPWTRSGLAAMQIYGSVMTVNSRLCNCSDLPTWHTGHLWPWQIDPGSSWLYICVSYDLQSLALKQFWPPDWIYGSIMTFTTNYDDSARGTRPHMRVIYNKFRSTNPTFASVFMLSLHQFWAPYLIIGSSVTRFDFPTWSGSGLIFKSRFCTSPDLPIKYAGQLWP